MEFQRRVVRVVDEDEMASYGMHPAVHQQLVRCHNPALYRAEEVRCGSPQPVQERLGRLMREPASLPDQASGITLSA